MGPVSQVGTHPPSPRSPAFHGSPSVHVRHEQYPRQPLRERGSSPRVQFSIAIDTPHECGGKLEVERQVEAMNTCIAIVVITVFGVPFLWLLAVVCAAIHELILTAASRESID